MSIKKILLVEDEAEIREPIRAELENLGHAVVESENGKEALKLIVEFPRAWLAIITDFQVPLISGGELILKVRKILPSLPIILMSGLSEDSEKIQELIRLGVPFIQKPFAMAQLRKVVATLGASR